MPKKQPEKKRKGIRPSERRAREQERLQDPHYIPAATRRLVMKRDGKKCTRCGVPDELVIHHILPVSEGGGREPENLVVLCMACHKAVHIERGDEYAVNVGLMKMGRRGISLPKWTCTVYS